MGLRILTLICCLILGQSASAVIVHPAAVVTGVQATPEEVEQLDRLLGAYEESRGEGGEAAKRNLREVFRALKHLKERGVRLAFNPLTLNDDAMVAKLDDLKKKDMVVAAGLTPFQKKFHACLVLVCLFEGRSASLPPNPLLPVSPPAISSSK